MALTPELLAELQFVDSDWRLIPCDGLKRPVNPATGELQADWAQHTYDADAIAELADSSFVKAVGLVLGEQSGVIAVDFDGNGAVAMFHRVYGRPWSDLPATVSWSSGVINRRQMAFRVPADMWPYLRGRRVWNNDAGRTVLELRGTGHQSVIIGAHPDTEGYRWVTDRSPAEQQVADAPDWLLEPMIRASSEPAAADYQPATEADVPRALDLLAHIRPRDDYDTWLRVGMALHSVSPGLLADWVGWSRGCSNFDEDECLGKWQTFKSSGTTIGSLHYLAEQDGYRYRRPRDEQQQQQPGKDQGPAATAGAADRQPSDEPATYRDLLAAILAAIRAGDDDAEMAARAEIMGRFRRTDGQIGAALFRLLTEQEQRTNGATAPRPGYRSIDLTKVVGIDWLLEGFLPANDQALLFAPAGAGKTTAALAMAFAVIEGTGFLDRDALPMRGSVLMIAADSGPAPLIRTLQDLGRSEHPSLSAAHDGHKLHVWAHDPQQGALGWDASLRGCLALLEFVQSQQIRLVIIDSCKAVTSRADVNYCDNAQVTALLTFMKEVVCQHTSVLWLNHDGTGGGEAAGAKAWKEIPSIVHAIVPIIEGGEDEGFEGPPSKAAKRISTWRRTWAVRKCRQGTAREFNYQIDEDTGALKVSALTEVIRDVRHGIGLLLWQALADGKASLHRRVIFAELGRIKGYSSGTVANSLTRASGGRRPMISRVGSMPGHWRLTPLARQWFDQSEGEPMPPL